MKHLLRIVYTGLKKLLINICKEENQAEDMKRNYSKYSVGYRKKVI